MRITSVSANNYRTLEEFELEFSDNYCTISGQNNAGKSGVVKIIEHFLSAQDPTRFYAIAPELSFARDRTQWSSAEEMTVSVRVEIHRSDDAELFLFVNKFSTVPLEGDTARVRLIQKWTKDGTEVRVRINGVDADFQSSSEVIKKFRSASNLVVHNSTHQERHYFFAQEGMTEVLEGHFSEEDRKKISDAEKALSKRVQQAAKQHKDALGQLLGRLQEDYGVELTTLERGGSATYPLSIKLTDKSVDTQLADWGSGTQNRTKVLISVLNAVRTRESDNTENKSTPVVIVEEPESFLHPSAQAEFGKLLNQLASELAIQIIATTHSPFMLNQGNPRANILLERRVFRNRLKETSICDTSGEKWMLPFAENLGLVPAAFENLKDVFSSQSNCILLVEGVTDCRYFARIKEKYPEIYKLPDEVEVVAYGGKDALKNTHMLKFTVEKFDRVFITFDLDAKAHLERPLADIGLKEGRDYLSIGVNKPGLMDIEGLLPPKLRAKIYAENSDMVAAINSTDSNARKHAQRQLKTKQLEAFEAEEFSKEELEPFAKLMLRISKALAGGK